jgi:hypothetical protein
MGQTPIHVKELGLSGVQVGHKYYTSVCVAVFNANNAGFIFLAVVGQHHTENRTAGFENNYS